MDFLENVNNILKKNKFRWGRYFLEKIVSQSHLAGLFVNVLTVNKPNMAWLKILIYKYTMEVKAILRIAC